MKPDIVNLTRLHLYEIKPVAAQALGASKAALAVGVFGRAGIAMQLGPIGEPGTEVDSQRRAACACSGRRSPA